jgi:hypothetical protein
LTQRCTWGGEGWGRRGWGAREREREGQRKRERETIRDMSPARVRQNGVTGLLIAAEKGHAEAVRLLVEGEADVNAAKKVHTPLRGLRV